MSPLARLVPQGVGVVRSCMHPEALRGVHALFIQTTTLHAPSPERTLFHKLVREYHPAFSAHLAAKGTVLPSYEEREFGAFLKCSRLEYEGASYCL